MNIVSCTFCLSSDRNLFFMEERSFHFIYSLLDIDDGQYIKCLQAEGKLRACWHCQALLKNFANFVVSAQRSLEKLRDYLNSTSNEVPLPAQTSLGTTEVKFLDIAPLEAEPSSYFSTKDEPLAFMHNVKLENSSPDDYSSVLDYEEEKEALVNEPNNEAEVGLVENIEVAKKKTVKKKSVKSKPESSKASEPRWSIRWVTCERATKWYEEQRASETGDFVCAQCKRSFDGEEALAQHIKGHHDESAGAFQCNVCKYRLSSRASLRAHIARHFVVCACALCPFEGRTVRAIRAHNREAHGKGAGRGKPTSYTCGRCKENFASFPLLREHRLECNTYKCAKCDRVFKNKFAYFDHLPLHKEGGKDKLYCQVCDKHFTNPKWFRTHFRTSLKHVSRDTFQHECPHCQLRFHIAQRLKEHVAAKHLNRGLYACDLCPKTFSINKSLKKHRARVHNIGSVAAPARDKVCEHCGKAFTSTWFLNDHMRLHTGEKPFKCTLCPAAFPQNGTLYIHTLVVHRKKLGKDGLTDSPSYQCEECGKEFPSNSRMRSHHKLVHLKLSRFNCEVCHVLFSSSASLKNHLASRHGVLAIDTFKCDACGKRYNTNTALKAHSKRHETAKCVHKCRTCDAEFKSSSGLQLHFKYVHLKLKRNDKVTLKNVGDPEKELIINGEPQRATT